MTNKKETTRMDAKIEAALAAADLSPEDTAKVVAALEAVTTDPGVGTVLREPATGNVAVFVRQYAETYWRVYSTDDRTWTLFEPIVGWDVLFDAPAVVSTPGDAAVDPVADPVADPAPTTTTKTAKK
jgi:hypothetical protein